MSDGVIKGIYILTLFELKLIYDIDIDFWDVYIAMYNVSIKSIGKKAIFGNTL